MLAQSLSDVHPPGQFGDVPLQSDGAHDGFVPADPATVRVQVPGVASHRSQPPAQDLSQQ